MSISSLRDRHVVVTGGAGGLGGAVVEALVAAGARCHLPVRKDDGGAPRAGVDVVGGVDLTDEPAVRAFFEGLPPLWASVHLAGGFAAAPTTETPLSLLRGQLEINLVTAFLCCREAARALRRGGAGGRIVNVSSRAAAEPSPGKVAYAAAKAGLEALTIGLAAELGGDGILVNAIAPSTIDTPANRAAMPDARHELWPKPEQLAQTVLFLIAPDNTVTSGAIVPVYGRS